MLPSATPVDLSLDVLDSVGDLELLARWVQWLHARGLSAATVRLYSYGVFRLLEHTGFVAFGAITEEHLASFLASIGNRSASRIQYLRGLRSLFGYLHRRGFVPTDPTRDLKIRKPWRPPPVALTEEELFRYLMAAYHRSPRRAWTLLLVFATGTRRMEAAEIRPEDVQGDAVLLRVCKYGKSRRVELSRPAQIALEELKPWWNGTVLGGVRRSTITEWAHQAALDSGLLPKVRGRVAHVLRASFITHLLNRGVPPQVVKELAGHESLNTTSSYAAVFDGQRAEAVRRLPFGAE